jgi:hypothetical protein
VEDAIFPFVLLPALVAELSVCLWLIVKGVDAARWSGYRGSYASFVQDKT